MSIVIPAFNTFNCRIFLFYIHAKQYCTKYDMMILLILLLFNQVNAQNFSKLPKTPRKVVKWPTKRFARTGSF